MEGRGMSMSALTSSWLGDRKLVMLPITSRSSDRPSLNLHAEIHRCTRYHGSLDTRWLLRSDCRKQCYSTFTLKSVKKQPKMVFAFVHYIKLFWVYLWIMWHIPSKWTLWLQQTFWSYKRITENHLNLWFLKKTILFFYKPSSIQNIKNSMAFLRTTWSFKEPS